MSPALAAMLVSGVLACDLAAPPPDTWRAKDASDGVAASVSSTPSGPWGLAEGIVPASADRILTHLVDFDAMAGFIPRLSAVDLLQRGGHDALVHFRYDLPWPLVDRDYTARYRWARLSTGEAWVEILDANEAGPPARGTVRVKDLRACFAVSPLGPDEANVRYLVHMDLGGLLPKAVSEQAVWKSARGTVLGLRRHFLAVADDGAGERRCGGYPGCSDRAGSTAALPASAGGRADTGTSPPAAR